MSKDQINVSDKKVSYFQFVKELDYPIYLECELSLFDVSLLTFLSTFRFTLITGDEVKKMKLRLEKDPNCRTIALEPASASVVRQLDAVFDGDRFGPESITPKDGYKVYRYKSLALMIASFSSLVWRVGVSQKFGSKAAIAESTVVLHRAVSLALSLTGVVGVWGHYVDEGVVVMKMKESGGAAVYLDLAKNMIISPAGIKPIPSLLSMIRLDQTLKGRSIRMKREELLSYLSVCVTFFDYQGITVPLRQILQKISAIAQGQIYPKESFKPKTDLSL